MRKDAAHTAPSTAASDLADSNERLLQQERFVEPGGRLRQQGRIDEAIALLKQGLLEFPGDPKLTLKLGESYLDAGDFDAAREHLEVVAAQDTRERVYALFRLSEIDFLQGNMAGAHVRLEALLEHMPWHMHAHQFLGRISFLEGDFEAAHRHFAVLAPMKPGGKSARIAEALEQYKAGQITRDDLTAALAANVSTKGMHSRVAAVLNPDRLTTTPVVKTAAPSAPPSPTPASRPHPAPTAPAGIPFTSEQAVLTYAQRLLARRAKGDLLTTLLQGHEQFPESIAILNLLMGQYQKRKQWPEALHFAEKALALDPWMENAWQARAIAAFGLGDEEAVRLHCRTILDHWPEGPMAAFSRKKMRELGDDSPEYALIPSEPTVLDTAYRLTQAGRPDTAIALLEQAAIEDPKNHKLLYRLAEISAASGDPEKAKRLLDQMIAAGPPAAKALSLRADLAFREGDLPLAQQHCDAALGLSAQFPGALSVKIKLLLAANDLPAAHDCTHLICRSLSSSGFRPPHSPAPAALREAVLEPAIRLRKARHLDQAVQHLQQGIKDWQAQDQPDILAELAHTLFKAHRTSEAEIYALRAFAERPFDAVALTILAHSARERGMIPGAKDFLYTAMKANSAYAPAFKMMGELFLQQGNVERALPFLYRAVQLAPRDHQAQRLLRTARGLGNTKIGGAEEEDERMASALRDLVPPPDKDPVEWHRKMQESQARQAKNATDDGDES